jgi:hypothetical protein
VPVSRRILHRDQLVFLTEAIHPAEAL